MVTNLSRSCCLPLFCFLMMVYGSLPTLAEPQDIDALKVAYLYNIAKFTSWPAATWASPTDPFQLCFYGKGAALEGMQALQNKEIDGHPIKLRRPEKEQDFLHCNAFYINTSERHRYRYLLSLINQQTVLVISDDSPFFDCGGLMNLVEKEQRLRFQVNMHQLSLSQLKLSSKLLKLAILVDNPR